MDNFFTSVELAEALIELNTTLVGTIRSNKRQLPKQFTSLEAAKTRGLFSSAFCFSGCCELTSYTAKTKKNVLLLSSAHATEEIDSKTGKPKVILDYNKYKGGVDTFDQMLRIFTCKRKSNRWPMILFFNMIDVAALAAFRLHEMIHPDYEAHKSEKRKIFLKELAFELATKQLENRCKTAVKSSVKTAMDLIGFKPPKMTTAPLAMPAIQVKNTKRRCQTCKTHRNTRDNKTTAVCDLCLKPTCSNHYVRACEVCYLHNFKDPDTAVSSESDEENRNDAAPSTSRTQANRRSRVDSIINL
ncbi:piggyBac transposable element-derived protein 4-like [Contarinia nasturtii]|uniref:piggyBac transposable element-derived protein 4-like n=1 Tax=Contarinia nasturtii TaxID=265458 RepID=UPI0012D3AB13|nr:piggyBac transposable element-derived protein 4-like [Contarinia nasturtii]